MDDFYIGAYWGSRADTIKNVTNQTLDTLQKLSAVDTHFSHWYKKGMSRKKALESEINYNDGSEDVYKAIFDSVKKGEINSSGLAKHGFVYGFWSGHSDEDSSSISFSVGMSFTVSSISNTCIINIPFAGSAKMRLLNKNAATQIIKILVEEWNPDYCVLTSDTLGETLKVNNKTGWITYRKSARTHDYNLSPEIITEQLPHGALFSLQTDDDMCYDYDLADKLAILNK